ncbi:hypothetical protein JXA12_03675, partial [Candidatus Woesearchaeota archaeon]|nr:hypothetical protein [Candidatus Woesearchaeota archaeon]
MTRRTLLLFLLLVLSLSLGCDRQVRYEDVNYYEGRDGLVFEFVENSPAERVYPEELVPVSIRVHNQGSFDLSSVYPAYYNGHESMVPMYATATLIYDDFFFFEDESFLDAGARSREELFLAGKSPYWPEGESRVVTLGMLQARSPGPQRLGADTDVSVSLCYPYETILTTPVCVASDLNEARPGDCLPEDLSFRDQGAPVAVTHVEVKSVPVRLERVLVDYGRGPEEVLQTVVRPVF